MWIVIFLTPPPPSGNGNTSTFSTDEYVMYIYIFFKLIMNWQKVYLTIFIQTLGIYANYDMSINVVNQKYVVFFVKKTTNVL